MDISLILISLVLHAHSTTTLIQTVEAKVIIIRFTGNANSQDEVSSSVFLTSGIRTVVSISVIIIGDTN